MPGKVWTDEQVEKLKELASSGNLSAAQMSIKLGVSRNSVIAKMARMQIPSLFNSKLKARNNRKKIPKKKISKYSERTARDFSSINHISFKTPTIFSKNLYDLGINECRWPVSDNGKIADLFCARRACGPYCEEHTSISQSKKIKERKTKNLLQFQLKSWFRVPSRISVKLPYQSYLTG